jgi:hypothetical protein
MVRTSTASSVRPSLRASQSSGRSIGGGGGISSFRSATPPTTRMPDEISRSSSMARAMPRTVLAGSCAFSKRIEASVRSRMADDVLRMDDAWKQALSSTTRVVLPVIELSRPPITPASAMAPPASAIVRLDGSSVYSSPLSARKSSPGRAGRMKMVPPRMRSASKACIG